MLKKAPFIKVLLAGAVMAGVAKADIITTQTFTFQPKPGDLYDLPHDGAYSWGINFDLVEGQVITGAKLEIKNLYNEVDNEWNALWIDLLDNAPAGIKQYYDGGATSDADYFSSGMELARLHWNEDNNDYMYQKKVNGRWTWVYGPGINDGLYMQRAGGPDMLIDGDRNNLVTIDFTGQELAALTSSLSNDNFGFGFDPDCHFYNCGIKFTMKTKTTPVPEPTLLSLLGCGLLGLLFVRRKK